MDQRVSEYVLRVYGAGLHGYDLLPVYLQQGLSIWECKLLRRVVSKFTVLKGAGVFLQGDTESLLRFIDGRTGHSREALGAEHHNCRSQNNAPIEQVLFLLFILGAHGSRDRQLRDSHHRNGLADLPRLHSRPH